MTPKISSGDRRSAQKHERDERHRRVKSKGCKSASFYGKHGRKHTLSSKAQKVLSTVLEDMIEDTLENARKLAQETGKNKVAIEDVEMAMINLCQRLQPQSNSRPDDITNEYNPPRKSQNKNHEQRLNDNRRDRNSG